MVSMGITTGLLMTSIYGMSLYKRVKTVGEVEVETNELLQMENELGESMFYRMMNGVAFLFIALALLFAVVVLSQFQDIISIGSMGVLLISTVNEVIKIMDFKQKKEVKKESPLFNLMKIVLLLGIYSGFTFRLCYSLF